MYERRAPPETPPCLTCRIDLFPENIDAAEIYMVSRDQIRYAGMDGTEMSIINSEIESAMRMKMVPSNEWWDCLLKVRSTFYHFLEQKRR